MHKKINGIVLRCMFIVSGGVNIRRVRLCCALCIFLFCFISLRAQSDSTLIDSSKITTAFDNSLARVEYFVGNDIDRFIHPDTSIDRFQKFNPARQQQFEYAYLGNLGSPYYPRLFTYDRFLGFDYGRHERDLYIFDISELKYFRSNVPFTNLYYITGSNNEQLFHGTYARNFGKDLNISFDFEKTASDGFFQRMKNDYNNVSLTGWYKNKKGNYAVYAGGIYSRHKNDENGGINNDDLFDSPNPEFQLPFRNEAFTEWKSWQAQATQQLLLGKMHEYFITDSTTGNYFAPAIALTHTFGAHNYFYLFEDSEFDTSIYGSIYDNADTLRDQSDVDGFYNRFSISNMHYKRIANDSIIERDLNWEIYGLQQYHEVSDQSGTEIIRNFITGINITKKFLSDSSFIIHADGAFDLFTNTYESNAYLQLKNFTIEPEFGITFAKYDPTQIQNKYYGFNYRWENNFVPVDYTKIYANFYFPDWKLNINYSLFNINNYIEFYGGFHQIENARVQQIVLHKNFVLGDFHLNNSVAYQLDKSSLSNLTIAIPEILANISWYYQARLFKGALFSQFGFDAWWCSDYYGYEYDFITGQWNTPSLGPINGPFTEPLTFQPVIDIFANFDIQTFRFFVKVDNIAQGLFSKGYFEAPNYPMQPRGFKLGVNWMLYY